MSTRPFVDFYRDNGISPVHQDIADISRHFERRESLYRTMGIPPSLLADRDVLEFGPGSGHNALHTASLKPSSYTLVDGNPVGLSEARKLLAEHAPECNVRFIESMIEEFGGEAVDIVICEGTIPFQLDPKAITRKVASFSRPGGLVTITTVDTVSYLAEGLRKLACECIADPAIAPLERLELLRPFLAPHLATLPAMSRPIDDWIWDNILQPLAPGLFSIPDAIVALDDDFDFYGSSPSFVTDLRWYKELIGEARNINGRAIAAYRHGIINFLDRRTETLAPLDDAAGSAVIDLSNEIVNIVLAPQLGSARDRAKEIVKPLRALRELVSSRSTLTAETLEFVAAMFADEAFDRFAADSPFLSFFGRGQQHVTFLRRAARPQPLEPGANHEMATVPPIEREADRWSDVKDHLGNERIKLGPYFTYIARNSPRRLLHLLSYYKFAAKMIGAQKRILEVGCSEGFGTLILAEQATAVLGVDLDADAIAIAKTTVESPKLQFRLGDVLTDELGTFDGAVTLDVIEHIYPDHEDAFVARIAGALEPDGVLVMGTPNVHSQQYASEISKRGHVNLFDAERLQKLGLRHFKTVFMFSANDEMVHTGYAPMAHYLIALCVGPRSTQS